MPVRTGLTVISIGDNVSSVALNRLHRKDFRKSRVFGLLPSEVLFHRPHGKQA